MTIHASFHHQTPQFTGDGSYGFCLKIGYPSTHWLIGPSIINVMVAIQHGQSPMWRFPKSWVYSQIIQVMDGHSVLKHIETHGDWGSCILRNPQYQNDHLGTHTLVILQWDHRFTTEKSPRISVTCISLFKVRVLFPGGSGASDPRFLSADGIYFVG
jgi:hypothetical protein